MLYVGYMSLATSPQYHLLTITFTVPERKRSTAQSSNDEVSREMAGDYQVEDERRDDSVEAVAIQAAVVVAEPRAADSESVQKAQENLPSNQVLGRRSSSATSAAGLN